MTHVQKNFQPTWVFYDDTVGSFISIVSLYGVDGWDTLEEVHAYLEAHPENEWDSESPALSEIKELDGQTYLVNGTELTPIGY